MAKWASTTVLDGGPNAIKSGASRMALIKSYSPGDSYAAVIANRVAEANMSSGDYTISTVGSDRRLTTAAKTGVISSAPSGVGPDLHIAFHDGTANVFWVTDETSNVVVSAGIQVNFPAITYDFKQPT